MRQLGRRCLLKYIRKWFTLRCPNRFSTELIWPINDGSLVAAKNGYMPMYLEIYSNKNIYILYLILLIVKNKKTKTEKWYFLYISIHAIL